MTPARGVKLILCKIDVTLIAGLEFTSSLSCVVDACLRVSQSIVRVIGARSSLNVCGSLGKVVCSALSHRVLAV